MSRAADGQLAFERQVAAFLGNMAEEIPAGRYAPSRTMLTRAHTRVAGTIVAAVLMLAALGVGGALLLRSVHGSAFGFFRNGSAGSNTDTSADTATPGAIGSGSDGWLNAAGTESQFGSGYVASGYPGQYGGVFPNDLGPRRRGVGSGDDGGVLGERGSRSFGAGGRFGNGGLDEPGGPGGSGWLPPPVWGGANGGGAVFGPPGGWGVGIGAPASLGQPAPSAGIGAQASGSARGGRDADGAHRAGHRHGDPAAGDAPATGDTPAA